MIFFRIGFSKQWNKTHDFRAIIFVMYITLPLYTVSINVLEGLAVNFEKKKVFLCFV